ncbi:MAG: hypothetical protein ACREQ5_05040 [Candidatus Dormibacteria bacterium]
MGSILSSTGQSGPAGPVTQALQAATQYQNNSAANQQQALGAYQNQIAQGANTLYNQTEAAVPVMQARTEQQVNSYYAQQRAQAQNDAEANAKAQQQLDIAIANAQAANSRAGTAATQQGTAQIQQGTAQINQNIADTKLGSTLATNGITVNGTGATTINNASKLVGTVMPQYPGFGDGQQGELAFYGLLAGDPAASKAPSYANVMSQINSLYSSNSPLVAGVNRQWLEMFVNAYFGRGSLPVPQQQTGILSAASQKILGSSPDLASAAASARTDTGNIG